MCSGNSKLVDRNDYNAIVDRFARDLPSADTSLMKHRAISLISRETTKKVTTKKPTTGATAPSTGTKKPATKQPTTKQPTTKQPTTKQPTTKQPTTKKPGSKTPPVPKVCGRRKGALVRRSGFSAAGYDETTDTFQVWMGSELLASEVVEGSTVDVLDLSGCSAVFFYDANGLPTTFHITAGEETKQVAEAIAIAQREGTTDSVEIWTYGSTKGSTIKSAIKKKLPSISATTKTYNYNAGDKKERWSIYITAGRKGATARKYSC